MSTSDATRAFLALTISPGAQEKIAALGERLKSGEVQASWEPSEKFHITLRFLGTLEPPSIESIAREVQPIAAGMAPFDIAFTHVGAFPHGKNPRIFWVGAYKSDILMNMMKEIETACRRSGLEPEHRQPHPHATLGRVKRWHSNTNLTALLKSITFDPIVTRTSELTLMKSVLHQRGSTYSSLMSFPFNRFRSTHD